MQLYRFDGSAGRVLNEHGSAGARITRIGRFNGPVTSVTFELDPGGHMGRHRTVGGQLLLVTAGDGQVSGDDGRSTPIRAGQAAYSSPGEMHETVAGKHGLTAVVLEAGELEHRLPKADGAA